MALISCPMLSIEVFFHILILFSLLITTVRKVIKTNHIVNHQRAIKINRPCFMSQNSSQKLVLLLWGPTPAVPVIGVLVVIGLSIDYSIRTCTLFSLIEDIGFTLTFKLLTSFIFFSSFETFFS